MTRIAIVTDSAANLPSHVAASYNVQIVPLSLYWDGRTYRDGVDLSPGELYRELRANRDDLPSTSSPSVGDFLRVYATLGETSDTIISIHLAAELSATYAAAQHAKSLLSEVPITVIDSRTATMGCGFVVLAAARAAAQRMDLPDVITAAQAVIERVHVYGVLDSLEYVHRSGRVPAIAAVAGSLLDLHPLLYVKKGEAGLLEMQRTKRRAVKRLLDVIETQAAGRRIHAAVMHADAAQEAADLCKQLSYQCDLCELLTTEFTPVMGANAGPGLLAVAFYPEVT
jgi:DegV family protein with EDD domain